MSRQKTAEKINLFTIEKFAITGKHWQICLSQTKESGRKTS